MKLLIKNLSVQKKKQFLLKNIDLKAESGQFVGIVGPNGSGKSTLIQSLLSQYRYTGEILLNEIALQKIPLKDLAKTMAYMGQFHEINFDIPVIETLLMGKHPYKRMLEFNNNKDYEEANETLEKLHLREKARDNFRTLSGGEKQRVIFGRALMQQPKILLLDEPTNHLDIQSQLDILTIAKKLDILVIIALHDLELAAKFCDTIYLLSRGEVVDKGNPEKVLNEKNLAQIYQVNVKLFKKPFTKELGIEYL